MVSMRSLLTSRLLSICITLLLLGVLGSVSASSAFAGARFELSPTTGQVTTTGMTVSVIVNADGNQLKSASAVIVYDATKITVTSVNGSYFPEVSTDTTKTGEIVISGTLPIGNTTGVTGSGTLATLTLKAVSGATGTPTLTFRCSASSSDDSNIINLADTNLLATTEQCAANSSGSYTLASTGDSSSGSSVAPGSVLCNKACTATRDCTSGLSCVSGLCRNPTCSTTTTCSCSGADIAAAQGASSLPETASVNETTLLLLTGALFVTGGGFLLWNQLLIRKREE